MTQDLFSNPALLRKNNNDQKTLSTKNYIQKTNSQNQTKAFSVSELNLALANMLTDKFSSIWVYGEVINFANIRGNWYFSLRDKSAQVNCIMFSSRNMFLAKPINDGLFIYVKASANIYSAKGNLQLVVEGIKLENEGDILKNIELLKQKLIQEGIFNKPKKQLPSFAKNIALITSAKGSVIHDITKVFEKNWQLLNLFVFDTSVQGEQAIAEICAAFAQIDADYKNYDLILLARGGGSNTDLAIFNDEKIIRSIYTAKIPVISAIGHATDTSLADLIADYAATTPTAAAEKICENFLQLKSVFYQLEERLKKSIQIKLNLKNLELRKHLDKIQLIKKLKIQQLNFSAQKNQQLKNHLAKIFSAKEERFLQTKRRLQNQLLKRQSLLLENKLDFLKSKLIQASPLSATAFLQTKLNLLEKQIWTGALAKQKSSKNEFLQLTAKLDGLSPLKVLSRGFALVTDTNSNAIIKDADLVEKNQQLKIQLAKGELRCQVLTKNSP